MFKCPDCLYLTDRRYNLNSHIKRKHQTCQKQAKTSSEENGHDLGENGHDLKENDHDLKENGHDLKENGHDLMAKNFNFEENDHDPNFFDFQNSKKFAEKNGKIAKNSSFECQNCKKQYKTKKYYENHIKTCNTFIQNQHQCQYCKKQLSSNKSKNNHLKICQTKQCQIAIEEHKKKETSNTNNIQTQNNNNQNIVNNITYNIKNIKQINRPSTYINNGQDSSDDEEYDIAKINNFGKENIDYISKETLDTLTDHIDIQKLIELKHFNPEHPENHNIRSNTRKSLKILTENKWKVHPKDDVFNQIFNRSKSQLFQIFLDHRIVNRHNLTDEEIEEISQRWSNYNKVHFKAVFDFINIQLEELIKQRNKTKQLPPTDSNPETAMI
jgi:hypothetical protein